MGQMGHMGRMSAGGVGAGKIFRVFGSVRRGRKRRRAAALQDASRSARALFANGVAAGCEPALRSCIPLLFENRHAGEYDTGLKKVLVSH